MDKPSPQSAPVIPLTSTNPDKEVIDMQNTTTHKHELDRTQSRSKAKSLRAAEARRRFELLQEERMLQDQLADFWDTRSVHDWQQANAVHTPFRAA